MAHTLQSVSKNIADAAAVLQHYYNIKSDELRKSRLYRTVESAEGDITIDTHKDKYDYYEIGLAFVRLTDESMETPTHMRVDEVVIDLDTDVLESSEEVATNMHLGREEYSKLKFKVTFRNCPPSEGHLALTQNAAEITKQDISTAARIPFEDIKKTPEEIDTMIENQNNKKGGG